ncbi:hypothetical protein AWENTII_002716 [Aspergillus wentii]|nr:hypothetical protein MW887_007727 [Aspergillus wentii]
MRPSVLLACASSFVLAAAVPVGHETTSTTLNVPTTTPPLLGIPSPTTHLPTPSKSSKPSFSPYSPTPTPKKTPTSIKPLFAPYNPSSTPTPPSTSTPHLLPSSTRTGKSKHKPASLASRIQSSSAAVHTPSNTPKPETCPSGKSKMCCTSIDGIGDQLTGGLGSILPYVGGIQISSILGLECKPMAYSDPEEFCEESIMCCHGAPTKDIFKTCEMFDKAIAKKHSSSASAAVAATTATPSLSPSPSPSKKG